MANNCLFVVIVVFVVVTRFFQVEAEINRQG